MNFSNINRAQPCRAEKTTEIITKSISDYEKMIGIE